MKKLLFLFSFLCISPVFSQDPINYKIFYSNDIEKEGLKIELRFKIDTKKDSTCLFFHNNSWGETNLFKTLSILEKDNPKIKFKTNPEKHQIVVYHKNINELTFTYRIKQDFKEPDYKTTFRPFVHQDYFHILGYSLFVVPEYLTDESLDGNIHMNLQWIGFPKNYTLHNNFESNARQQILKINLWEDLYRSLFIGGDYRIQTFTIKEKPVHFAVRGKWFNGYTDDFFIKNLKKAIQSQRDFWKDYDQDYFTVTLTPTVTQNDSLYKGSSNTGSAIRNGFIMLATNNPFNDKEAYKHILHHELMHNWIGSLIKNKHERLNYWFSEGFTDYYAHKNKLRVKDLSIEEWKNAFNADVIIPHFKNPQKNIANFEVHDGFWKSRDIEKIPYRRGAIFAFWLDNQILIKSNYTQSLDNLMLDLLKECTEKNLRFTDELLLDFAQKYLEKDISYFFQKHLLNGEDINLEKEQWIDGFYFEKEKEIPVLKISNSEAKYLLN